MHKNHAGMAVAAATLFSVQSIVADAATPVVLEEVIVTAQKREQNLQDVPLSVLGRVE